VYAEGTEPTPEEIAERGVKAARDGGYDFVIVDTAGRQVVDQDLMDEIKRVRSAVRPHSVLLVLDVVTGQNAVEIAEVFKEYVDYDGMVLTKLDGDARGGAALSVVSVTDRPIKFASEGEKMSEFDYFYPDRMAGRILGMGDVLTLIEKAEGQMDQREAEAQSKKLLAGKFDFEDFLKQMQMIKKMGPLSSLLGMIPGLSKQLQGANLDDIDDKALGRVEAMITSMTVQERRNPKLLQNPSRARRIARGSGSTQQDVQKLVKQFGQMQKMMKQMGKGGSGGGIPKRMPRMPFR
jgi:signal recognition particle subunit SRP54